MGPITKTEKHDKLHKLLVKPAVFNFLLQAQKTFAGDGTPLGAFTDSVIFWESVL